MKLLPRAAALVTPAAFPCVPLCALLMAAGFLGGPVALFAQGAGGDTSLSGRSRSWNDASAGYYRALEGKSVQAADWAKAAAQLHEFWTQEQTDDSPTAKALEALALFRAAELGGAISSDQLSDALAQVKGESALPPHVRFIVASRAREVAIELGPKLDFGERLDAYADSARAMIAEFPTEEDPYRALLAIAEDHPDTAKAKTCAQELAAMATAPAELKSAAGVLLAREELVGRSFDATALALTKKSAAQLQGYVVVLYTWRPGDPTSSAMRAWIEAHSGARTIAIDLSASSVGQSPLQLTAPGLVYLIDKRGVIRDVHGNRNFREKLAVLQKEDAS